MKELIDAPVTDGNALAQFFASTTPDEYTQIADKFCEEYNLSIDQALVRPLKENEDDLEAYAAAHFALHGLPVLAAQLINKACRPKNGNERSICRITTLMVDQCLAAKYAYKLYGDMGQTCLAALTSEWPLFCARYGASQMHRISELMMEIQITLKYIF